MLFGFPVLAIRICKWFEPRSTKIVNGLQGAAKREEGEGQKVLDIRLDTLCTTSNVGLLMLNTWRTFQSSSTLETISEEQPAMRRSSVSAWLVSDQKTALTSSLFDSSSVSFCAEGKRLRDILDEIEERENAVKVVVALGKSGVGKPSIGNCLLSLKLESWLSI